ncbi:MAG: AAA family ATPase [Treponema sp.]|nr:AAA family ATPase [Treponema sp.]
MGIYLNPGNENFVEITSAKIYVDKSMMIAVLDEIIRSSNKYICVSRPRRFGKTVNSNMLASYYSKGCDSRELFSKYKISQSPLFGKDLNKLNVIKIDVNSEYRNALDKDRLILKITKAIRLEMQQQFPELTFNEDDSVADGIVKIFAATGQQFVILMDEYDVLVRENVSDALFSQYLDLLNGLFKSDTVRPAIALAYLTGILPVIRDKVQSKLNNFREYTILDSGRLSEYLGFTESEVQELCKKYSIDFDDCRNWYDGYHLAWNENGTQKKCEIYNPESVVMSIETGKFAGFWGATSSYEVISDRIQQNFAGIKDDVIRMISGESVDVNVTSYKNTMKSFVTKSDVLTYLIHLGYLAYNDNDSTCKIPNKEVRQEWINALEADKDYSETNAIIKASKELLSETLAGNAEAVAASLDESHIHVTSNRSYNNEYALQSAIYLSFIYALNKYTCFRELTTGKGFADMVYVPLSKDLPALIIELKHNKCAQTALSQIKEKQYFDSLKNYSGNMLFVGINYDENTKKHDCKIEKLVKD